MDAIDRAILEILEENAKLGTKEIAQQVGLSVTPTYERIKKLEREGIIQRYTIELDKKKIGKGLQVICYVSLKEHNLNLLQQFEEQIIALPEVVTCYHVAGDHDYALMIDIQDMETYEQFLRHKLTAIPSIVNVRSSFVMNEIR